MKTNNIFRGVKCSGLRLIPNPNNPAECIDQYGRILEVYKDEKGKKDLRPTGRTTTARH